MQTSERGVYIGFVKSLLHLSEELVCLGDFIIIRKYSIKNGGLGPGVVDISWHMRFNHGCNLNSRILRAIRSYDLPDTLFP